MISDRRRRRDFGTNRTMPHQEKKKSYRLIGTLDLKLYQLAIVFSINITTNTIVE